MPSTLDTLRQQYPQYSDLSDQQLLDGFHQKFYSDMSKDDFYKKVGFNPAPTPAPAPAQAKHMGLGERALNDVQNAFAAIPQGIGRWSQSMDQRLGDNFLTRPNDSFTRLMGDIQTHRLEDIPAAGLGALATGAANMLAPSRGNNPQTLQQNPFYHAGQTMRGQDVPAAQNLPERAVDFAGGIAPLALGGWGARVLSGAASSSQGAAEAAEQQGASPDQAESMALDPRVWAPGAVMGGIPGGRLGEAMLGRTFGKQAAQGLEKSLLGRMAKTGVEASALSAAQQLGTNMAARDVYNPLDANGNPQSIWSGVPEAALAGGIGGGLFHGASEIGGAAVRKVAGKAGDALFGPGMQAAGRAQRQLIEDEYGDTEGRGIQQRGADLASKEGADGGPGASPLSLMAPPGRESSGFLDARVPTGGTPDHVQDAVERVIQRASDDKAIEEMNRANHEGLVRDWADQQVRVADPESKGLPREDGYLYDRITLGDGSSVPVRIADKNVRDVMRRVGGDPNSAPKFFEAFSPQLGGWHPLDTIMAKADEARNAPFPQEPTTVGLIHTQDAYKPFTEDLYSHIVQTANDQGAVRAEQFHPLSEDRVKDPGLRNHFDVEDALNAGVARGDLKYVGNNPTEPWRDPVYASTRSGAYDSTAGAEHPTAGDFSVPDGSKSELRIKPLPVNDTSQDRAAAQPDAKAEVAMDKARDEINRVNDQLNRIPQDREDDDPAVTEARASRREALQAQKDAAEEQLSKAQTGRGAFGVVERITMPNGATKERLVQAFPSRDEAQKFVAAKKSSADPAARVNDTLDDARVKAIRSRLASALRSLGLSGKASLNVASYLFDKNAGFYTGSHEATPTGSIINIARDVYDPSLSVDEQVAKMMKVLNHEVIHALKHQGLINPEEYRHLDREASTRKVGDREYTYLQQAYRQYWDIYHQRNSESWQAANPSKEMSPADKDAVAKRTEEQVREEAIANLHRDWDGKVKSRYAGIVNKVAQYFRHIFGAMSNADKVFQKIRSGEVGKREQNIQAKPGEKPESMFALNAWHGSPYAISKFQDDKIGSGEGAQAYGYGHYFAGSKKTGEYYRESVTAKHNGNNIYQMEAKADQFLDRERANNTTEFNAVSPTKLRGYIVRLAEDIALGYNPHTSLQDMRKYRDIQAGKSEVYAKSAANAERDLKNHIEIRKSIGMEPDPKITAGYREMASRYRGIVDESEEAHREYAKAVELGEKFVAENEKAPEKPTGRLYNVDIPDDHEYLSWDKDLPEQSQHVQDAMMKMMRDDPKIGDIIKRSLAVDTQGRSLYWRLQHHLGSPKAVSDLLKAYDVAGIKYLDGMSRRSGEGSHNYVVFDPDRVSIKDVHPPLPRELLADPNTKVGEPMYSLAGGRIYSGLEDALVNAKQEKARAREWKDIVARLPGVKKEELEWSGLSDWLTGIHNRNHGQPGNDVIKGDQLSKEELVDFVRNHGVKLQELFLGDTPENHNIIQQQYKQNRQDFVRKLRLSEPVSDKYLEGYGWDPESQRIQALNDTGKATRHGQWMLGGGQDEGNLLITIPTHQTGNQQFVNSSHWNAPNVLSWVRYKTRYTPDGKKVLFIEENQSDWHQQGRKLGYSWEDHDKIIGKLVDKGRQLDDRANDIMERYGIKVSDYLHEARGYYGFNGDEEAALTRASNQAIDDTLMHLIHAEDRTDQENKDIDELRKLQDQLTDISEKLISHSQKGPVPDAPFKDSWDALAMKRIMLYAADHGYDMVGWTRGQHQADRWNNDKFKDFYDRQLPGVFNKMLKPYGAEASIRPVSNWNHPMDWLQNQMTRGDADAERARESYELYKPDGTDTFSSWAVDVPPALVDRAEGSDKVFPMFSLAGKPHLDPKGPTGPISGMHDPAAMRSAALSMAMRYTVVHDMIERQASKFGIDPMKLRPVLDESTRNMQDQFFPVRRLMSEIAKTGGKFSDLSDPAMREALFIRMAQERVSQMNDAYYKPAERAAKAINATDADITSLSRVSDLASKELQGMHTAPSIALLNLYLYARHAPERNRFIETVRKRKDPDVKGAPMTDGSGMSNDEAKAIMDWFAGFRNFDKVKAAAAHVDEIIQKGTREVRIDGGLTPDFSKLSSPLIPQFDHYVTLKGVTTGDMDERDLDKVFKNRAAGGFDMRGKEDKAMMGRQSYAGNIFVNTLLQSQEAIWRAEKNKVAQAFLKFVEDNAEQAKGAAEVVDKLPMKPYVAKDGTVQYHPDSPYFGSDRYFIAKRDGDSVVMEIKDPFLRDALKMSSSLGDGFFGKIMGGINKATKGMSMLATTLNPQFFVSNWFRDVQEAMIQSGQYDETAWKGILDKAKNYAGTSVKDMLTLGDLDPVYRAKLKDLSMLGGLTGWHDLDSFDGHVKRLNKELAHMQKDPTAFDNAVGVMKHVAEYVETLNDALEGATRLSVFETMLEKGFSRDRAAYIAKELTINFNKKGKWGPAMNALYMFSNAATQGTATMARSLTSPTVRKTAMGMFIAGALLEGYDDYFSDKDEQGNSYYEKIIKGQPWVANNNYVMMIPHTNGAAIKIPQSRGWSLFFNLGRNAARVALGKQHPWSVAPGFLQNAISAFNPIGEENNPEYMAIPSLLRPVAEVLGNKDWTGANIHPSGGPGNQSFPPPSSQAFPSTTPQSQMFSQFMHKLTGGDEATPGKLEIYPGDLDYLFSAYMGGAGKTMSEAGNLLGWGLAPEQMQLTQDKLRVADIPLVRQFALNTTDYANTRAYQAEAAPYITIESAYRNAERTGDDDALKALTLKYPNELMLGQMVGDYQREIVSTQREISKIQQQEGMTVTQKVQAIQMYRQYQKELMQNAMRDIKGMEKSMNIKPKSMGSVVF